LPPWRVLFFGDRIISREVDAAVNAVVVAAFCEFHIQMAQQRPEGFPERGLLRTHAKKVRVALFNHQ
jgi:hypothetical protein